MRAPPPTTTILLRQLQIHALRYSFPPPPRRCLPRRSSRQSLRRRGLRGGATVLRLKRMTNTQIPRRRFLLLLLLPLPIGTLLLLIIHIRANVPENFQLMRQCDPPRGPPRRASSRWGSPLQRVALPETVGRAYSSQAICDPILTGDPRRVSKAEATMMAEATPQQHHHRWSTRPRRFSSKMFYSRFRLFSRRRIARTRPPRPPRPAASA